MNLVNQQANTNKKIYKKKKEKKTNTEINMHDMF